MTFALDSLFPFATLLPARRPGATPAHAPGTRHAMAKRAILVVPSRTAERVTCVQGSLWVTQDGDLEDTVLAAGETHSCRPGARTVVQALRASTLVLG